ncbi:MAG TPA: hypothetical protein VMF89_02255 [Polyangiales bacterium]|nr:hypothetical protein [Polyangiales bacterium]
MLIGRSFLNCFWAADGGGGRAHRSSVGWVPRDVARSMEHGALALLNPPRKAFGPPFKRCERVIEQRCLWLIPFERRTYIRCVLKEQCPLFEERPSGLAGAGFSMMQRSGPPAIELAVRVARHDEKVIHPAL